MPTDDRHPASPASARRLQAAVEALDLSLRQNPSAGSSAPEVLVRLPEADRPWVSLGTPRNRAGALAAAKLPAATLVKAVRGDRRVWFGVIDAAGEAVEAPPMPKMGRAPVSAPSWDQAWNGPRAEGPWMLSQSGRVGLATLTRATLACVRLAVPHLPSGETRPLALIEAVERYLGGQRLGTIGPAMWNVARFKDERADALEADRSDANESAFWAACAVYELGSLARADGSPPGGRSTMARQAAEYAADATARPDVHPEKTRRQMAALVRAEIPLGVALLAIMSAPMPEEGGGRG